METARLETFSDGIFAIAATLLILDVRVEGDGSLTTQLLHAWPTYVGYVTSFLTNGIMWVNHRSVFRQIDRVDRTFLALNVLALMVIAFIPFPTRVLAAHLHHDARSAAVFYGLTNTAMAITYSAVWFYAARGGRLIAASADPRAVSGISRSFRPGIPLYALATASAFVSSWLAVSLFGALALFYLVESSLLGGRGSP
jgi:uncharacterized membrane protein